MAVASAAAFVYERVTVAGNKNIMTRFIFALLAAIACYLPAQSEPVDGGYALVELISDHASAEAGDTISLALKLKLDEGWHVYWRNPGDAGLPPQINWDEETRAEFSEFEWPIPELLPVVPNQIMDYGYSDIVVLPFEATLPANASGTYTFTGTADYLICEEICIPETAPISLTVDIGPASLGVNAREITEWREKTPTVFEGVTALDRSSDGWTLSFSGGQITEAAISSVRFFPNDHHIVHSAAQPITHGTAGSCIALTEATDGFDTSSIPEGIIVVETADGTRAGYKIAPENGDLLPGTCAERPLMPAIEEAGIGSGNYSEGGSVTNDASTGSTGGGFSLFAILPFAFLGGLILNLMPCVLPVLSIKALGMTHAAASGHTREMKVHGLAYSAGVILSFAALAAAFLAVRGALGNASLGFQLQNAPTVIVLTLIVFLVGLWLLGMFELGTSIQNTGSGLAAQQGTAGAFFTGVLAAVVGAPCVGPFLGASLGAVIDQPSGTVMLTFVVLGLGMALPFLLLSFAPGLQKLLPKPGPWMETLKQFFAFPMFITAAWLLSVLGALTDYSVVGWTIAGASAIAFGIWVWNNLPRAGLRPVMQGLGAIALIGGLVAPIAQAMKPEPAPITANAIIGDWSPTYVDQLLDDGHGIFVDFTAVWCVTCQANKATTLNRDEVKRAFAENNIAFLTADFTKRDPVIAEELALRQRPGVPMYLYYPPGEREPQILPEVLTPGLVIGRVTGK